MCRSCPVTFEFVSDTDAGSDVDPLRAVNYGVGVT